MAKISLSFSQSAVWISKRCLDFAAPWRRRGCVLYAAAGRRLAALPSRIDQVAVMM
jgi:hypothetical protein